MAKVQARREPLGAIQWRAYFIEDYSDTESIVVYKFHHAMGDGISTILLFFNLVDNPDFRDFPSIMIRFPVLQEVLIMLGSPFIFVFYLVRLLLKPKEKNQFTEPKVMNNLKAERRVYFSKDIGVNDVKNATKKLSEGSSKITFNDVLMTVLSKTLKSHSIYKGYPDLDALHLCCPFSMRKPPIGIQDFTFNNDFCVLFVKLSLVDNLIEGIKRISHEMNLKKKSLEPVGM